MTEDGHAVAQAVKTCCCSQCPSCPCIGVFSDAVSLTFDRTRVEHCVTEDGHAVAQAVKTCCCSQCPSCPCIGVFSDAVSLTFDRTREEHCVTEDGHSVAQAVNPMLFTMSFVPLHRSLLRRIFRFCNSELNRLTKPNYRFLMNFHSRTCGQFDNRQ